MPALKLPVITAALNTAEELHLDLPGVVVTEGHINRVFGVAKVTED